MSSPTPFTGLTALTPGEPLSDDGYKFQWADRFLIDRLLRIGATTHLHDDHAALANPTDAAALGNPSSGGQIPAGLTAYATYTWLDANGGETLPAPVASVTMSASSTDPTGAPDGVVDYSAGGLLAGVFSYALTLTDGLGGESGLGPAVEVEIAPGNPTAQIALSGMLTIMSDAAGGILAGVGWRLWRQAESGPWYLIGTGNGDAFTDSGVAGDCTVAPPFTSTIGGTNALQVEVPVPPGGVAPTQFAIYASTDGSFTSPALLGIYPIADAGATKTYPSLTVGAGAPPRVSTSFPGAHKINALTEITNLYWKAPVAASADLPGAANALGDARVALDTFHIWVWDGAAWHDASVVPPVHWLAPAATFADLPATGDFAGDARITLDTAHLYIWDGAAWRDVTGGGGGGGGGVGGSVPTWTDLGAAAQWTVMLLEDTSALAIAANPGGATTAADWWLVYAPVDWTDNGKVLPDTQIAYGWRAPRDDGSQEVDKRAGDAMVTVDTHELYAAVGGWDGLAPTADWVKVGGNIIKATQQAANYTFTLGDMGTVVESTAVAAVNFTIPPNADVALPVGCLIEVFQDGAGQVTIVAGTGVTLRSDGAAVHTVGQYATIRLRQRAADEWVLSGDLA